MDSKVLEDFLSCDKKENTLNVTQKFDSDSKNLPCSQELPVVSANKVFSTAYYE